MNFEKRLSMDENEPALNLTPLMDIMFLLVIFFAVSTTFKVAASMTLTVSAERLVTQTKRPSGVMSIPSAPSPVVICLLG